ncbi:MAG: glycosyltransferase [Bacteroidia bacterium]|nr:glycosyltransferase [Bacteroidia bacterium]
MTDLSVIIPVYNESENILNLYGRVTTVARSLNVSYEIILVNDGSKDDSLAQIKKLSLSDAGIKYISFSRNFGHQVAVSAGMDKSRGNAVVIIDADMQDPPELISELYKKFSEGYDVVYAKRSRRKDRSILKKAAYKLFYRILARISSVSIPLDTGDFRIISRKVADVLKGMPEQQKFLRGQIAWIGFRQTFIEYEREQRAGGEPGYTYKKLFHLAMDGITSFSNVPLRLATIAGVFVSGISFLLILYALYSYLFLGQTTPKGWTSLMVSILFIGGIQLLSIGIIGEYISRLISNVRNRPLYIIDETNVDKEA